MDVFRIAKKLKRSFPVKVRVKEPDLLLVNPDRNRSPSNQKMISELLL